MRDAFLIKGKEINYMDTNWVITELYYVPNNPNLYVELYDGKSRMNVILDSIKDLIISPFYKREEEYLTYLIGGRRLLPLPAPATLMV